MSQKRKRAYFSPLRQRQAAVTHRRIIDAAIAVLAARPGTEISHEGIGRAAGIAARTVYRHFPTRQMLLDEIWEELDLRLGLSEFPTGNSTELIAFVPELFRRLDDNAAIVDALITSSSDHKMSRGTDARRLRAIEQALAHETEMLPHEERDRLIGIVRVLTSPITWHVLHQKTRVTGEQPARAVTWALKQLIPQTAPVNTR